MATTEDLKAAASLEQVEDLKNLKSLPELEDAPSHVAGNALLVDKHGNIRRLPIPSNDPNDPLNWPKWEKMVLMFTCCWFSIMGLSLAGGLGAIINVFFAEYTPAGYTSSQIVFLITLPSLCIGLGNYIILPLALAYGRRPIFLGSTIVLLAATVGSAANHSYNGHLASRVVQGLATGASESLLPLIVTEITFLHERGRFFAVYWMVQNVFSSALNLASSYENAALGWRWYYWVFVITIALGLVFVVFFGFETRFARPAASIDGQVVVTDEFGVTRVVPDGEAQKWLDRMDQSGSAFSDSGNAMPKQTYVQRLKPWSQPHARPLQTVLLSWAHMLQSITSPALLYAVLISSITLGCAVAMSLTYDTVLSTIYGWPSSSVGLINIGGVLGGVLGMLYCTLLGDPLVLLLARRNKGVHLPEHRLLVLIFPALLGFSMLLLYGFTAGGGSTWWGPYVAWTLFQGTFTAVLIVSTTFASEASVKHPGPALVMVVGTKNIVSFGVAYGLTPMVEMHGYRWAMGVLAGVFGAVFVSGAPVYVWNPRWRSWVARREAEGTTD